MKNLELNIQELSIKEQKNIDGGGFFTDLGVWWKKNIACGCAKMESITFDAGSREEILSDAIKW